MSFRIADLENADVCGVVRHSMADAECTCWCTVIGACAVDKGHGSGEQGGHMDWVGNESL